MSLKIKKFYANWCAPCKEADPALSQVVEEMSIELEQIDVETGREQAIDYNVRSIPTFIIFKNDKEIGRVTGPLPYEKLKQKVEGFLNG